jgi:hypothetical protein
MEEFKSIIELRFNNRKIEFKNFFEIDSSFLKPGAEIWQVLYYTKTNKILHIKLTTILKTKNKL